MTCCTEFDKLMDRDLARNAQPYQLSNGTIITEHWLRHGDRIGIGDSLLLFLTQEDEDLEPAGTVEFDEDNLPLQATVHLRPEDAVYLHPRPAGEEDSLSAALSRRLTFQAQSPLLERCADVRIPRRGRHGDGDVQPPRDGG